MCLPALVGLLPLSVNFALVAGVAAGLVVDGNGERGGSARNAVYGDGD